MDTPNLAKKEKTGDGGRSPGYTFDPVRGFLHSDPGQVVRQTVIEQSRRLGLSLLAYYVLSVIFSFAARGLLSFLLGTAGSLFPGRGLPLDILSDSLGIIATAMGLLIPFSVFMSHSLFPRKELVPFRKVKPAVLLMAVLCTLAAAVIGSYAAGAVDNLLGFFRIYTVLPSYSLGLTPASVAVSLVQLVLVPAVIEEVVFRGVVLQSLRPAGNSFALIVSSLTFALLHGNPVQMPYAFLLGLVIGYFVLVTGSVVTGILAHLCNNLLTVALSYGSLLSGISDSLLSAAVFGVILLLGITVFIAVSRRKKTLFDFPSKDSVLPFDSRMLLFLTQWEIVLSVGAALFLMAVKTMRVI